MLSVMPFSNRQPDFDRLRTALLCGQPDCVPALELFHDVEVKEAFLGRPLQTIADDVEFHYAAGYDYYSAWVVYRELRQQIAADLDKPVTITGSPYENVRPRHWSPERGGIITSLQDFEAFPWPRPRTGFLEVHGSGLDPLPLDEAIRQITQALPAGMGLILCTDGIFERFTKDLMGYETFCYKLHDEPELIWRVFAMVGELWLALYEQVAALPQVSALWLADDIAYGQGLMFSPEVMRQHLFPWYRRIGQVAAHYDKPLLFHSDGDLRPILDDLIACGVKALQPIEPKAMDIVALKRDYEGRLCLIGNIDLGSTLTRGRPDDVRAEVHERIRRVGPGGGYCVGSSNSVTNYVPLPNFKAMLEATFEYGRYPLS
jgi:uroporphyrinogen decarboxylase